METQQKKELKLTAKRIFSRAKKDSIGGRAAALAFYMIFALIPVLILLISGFGFFYTKSTVEQNIINYFAEHVGPRGGVFFAQILEGISSIEVNTIASIIGIIVILYAATNLFQHLQKTFSRIFNVREVEDESIIKKTLKVRLLAFSYMIILFSLMFIVVLGNIWSSLFFQSIRGAMDATFLSGVFHVAQYVTTLAISVGIFTAIYYFAAASTISWKSAFTGASIAALLFGTINIILSLYLSFSDSLSAYGAAGFFIAFLFWFYYVSLSLFFGAEIAAEHAWINTIKEKENSS